MKTRLLELLICPEDYSDLGLSQVEMSSGEIKSGTLTCAKNSHRYSIFNFIPRFIESDFYVRNFSMEWLLHSKTQYDSITGLRNSEQVFLAKTGFEPRDLQGRLVLDGGCGAGRFIEIARKFGAEVVGLDLSQSIDAARMMLSSSNKVHFMQANLLKPPLRSEVFDCIYSIGVLHHTPAPKRAFLELTRLLKPEGEIAVWLYPEGGFLVKLSNAFGSIYRTGARIMSLPTLYRVCEKLQLTIPMHKVLLDSGEFTAQKTISSAYFHPRQVVYLLLPFWSLAPTAEWRTLDTFDYLSPKYQSKHNWKEVKAWYLEAGLTNIRLLPTAVSYLGTKPRGGNQVL